VTDLRTTDVFGGPNLIVELDDPDGSLSTALLLVPEHIPVVSFQVADAKVGWSYNEATVLIQEVNRDGSLSLMFAARAGDVSKVPVDTA
jgi:hypothetical protein